MQVETETETREKWMIREELRLKQMMMDQYYRYLSLLRVTNNFEKRLDTYARLNFNEYQGQIAVVGRVSEIEMGGKGEEEYWFPVLQTTVSRGLFEGKGSRHGKGIVRRLVVSDDNYRLRLVVPLNKVMTAGKKNKDQLFIFTHLQLLFREEREVCFGFSEYSLIVQLDTSFYFGLFYNLEQGLAFTYSDLNLAEFFPDADASSTFSLAEIRTKIHENLNDFVVMGVLRRIIWTSMRKAVNAKEKEVILEVGQDTFQPRYRSTGICRIYVRFDIMDEKQLLSHLKEGCVYLFLVSDVLLSDSASLLLKLQNWQRNFIRVTKSPGRVSSLADLYKGMACSEMNYFTNPCIFRNHYKFKVLKYELKLLYAKVVCEKCETAIYRSTAYEYTCRSECGRVQGELRPWAIVGVMDAHSYGELSIENQAVLDYFNVDEEDAVHFKDAVAREEQEEGKSGVTLYFKRTREEFSEEEPNTCITPEKNEFLGTLIERFLVQVIEKTVIGYGRINTNENFSAIDQDTRHEALTSFAKPKEFLKKAKVFVNGNLRTFEGKGRLIPYIRVECVL